MLSDKVRLEIIRRHDIACIDSYPYRGNRTRGTVVLVSDDGLSWTECLFNRILCDSNNQTSYEVHSLYAEYPEPMRYKYMRSIAFGHSCPHVYNKAEQDFYYIIGYDREQQKYLIHNGYKELLADGSDLLLVSDITGKCVDSPIDDTAVVDRPINYEEGA